MSGYLENKMDIYDEFEENIPRLDMLKLPCKQSREERKEKFRFCFIQT